MASWEVEIFVSISGTRNWINTAGMQFWIRAEVQLLDMNYFDSRTMRDARSTRVLQDFSWSVGETPTHAINDCLQKYSQLRIF